MLGFPFPLRKLSASRDRRFGRCIFETDWDMAQSPGEFPYFFRLLGGVREECGLFGIQGFGQLAL